MIRLGSVLQVATYDKGTDKLHKYKEWGYSNGLQKNELKFLDKQEVFDFESHVKCLSTIYCFKDGGHQVYTVGDTMIIKNGFSLSVLNSPGATGLPLATLITSELIADVVLVLLSINMSISMVTNRRNYINTKSSRKSLPSCNLSGIFCRLQLLLLNT